MSILPGFLTRKKSDSSGPHKNYLYGSGIARELTLVEILQKYPTDKLNSGFGEYYEKLFRPYRYQAEAICEIGIAQGGSLRAWADYFPRANIVGIDNEQDWVNDLQRKIMEPNADFGTRIFPMWVDAGSDELKTIAASRFFDIVIDDGSHEGIDIINAFAILWPIVNDGGLYVVEDVGSSRPDPSMASDYFADHIYGTVVNDSRIEELIFRPNMIVVRKKCK